MEDLKVELLTEAHNFAVVQLPGRRFPGVVMQGDSLNALIRSLERIRALALEAGAEEIAEELLFKIDDLLEVRQDYERVCLKHGKGLPW